MTTTDGISLYTTTSISKNPLITHLCTLTHTNTQVASFVAGLFDTAVDIQAFKLHLRDFLITITGIIN